MDEALRSKVLTILENEQKELENCLDPQTDVNVPQTLTKIESQTNPDGSLSEKVTEDNTGYITEDINFIYREKIKDDAKSLQQFCKIIDDKILYFNSIINSKKQEIVNLSTEATQGNCWPGVAHSLGSTTTVTSFYGSKVTMKNDIENIRIYPNIAGPNVRHDVENPFEPDAIYNLSSIYSGYGYKNLQDPVFYRNKDGVLVGISSDGSGGILGSGRFDISTTQSDHNARLIFALPYRYYEGAGVAPNATNTSVTPSRCVSIANSIASIYNEIIELRKQRDSLREDLNNIKNNKQEKELSSWGISNVDYEIAARSTKNLSAIESVKAYDSNDLVNLDALVLSLDVTDPDSYSGIGTTWYDISGYENDATLFPTSSPASYDYSNGGFLTFNGIDEYAQTGIKTTNILGVGTTWTIESWFKINGSPSSGFSTVVSTTGTITALSETITGITTTSIVVGQYVLPISGVIATDTVVSAIGVGSVFITPQSINTDTTSRTFSFGTYPQYANTIVDVNATSTTTNMLGVTYGQSGIFSGISTNRFIYITSQTGIGTTYITGSTIQNGYWYHGAVVRNGTTNTKLYINGQLVNTFNGDLSLGTGSTTSVKIAAFTDELVYSNESISLVKIYRKAYTDAEIKNKFDSLKNRYTLAPS